MASSAATKHSSDVAVSGAPSAFILRWDGQALAYLANDESDSVPQLAALLGIAYENADPGVLTEADFEIVSTRSRQGFRAGCGGEMRWFERRGDFMVNALYQASSALLARSKNPLLHAGAVVADGEAVLFSGAPFAGKSSLALHAWLQGHALIGDDLLVLEPSMCEVRAFPRPLKPRVPSLDIPTSIRDKAGDSNLAIGRFVHDIGLFVGRNAPGIVSHDDAIPVRSLYFLERGATTHRQPLDRRSALPRVLEQITPGRQCLGIAGLIEHLAQRHRIFRLTIADDDQAGALKLIIDEP